MNDLINMETCRKLREVIHVLTETPVITKKEFLELAFFAGYNNGTNRKRTTR